MTLARPGISMPATAITESPGSMSTRLLALRRNRRNAPLSLVPESAFADTTRIMSLKVSSAAASGAMEAILEQGATLERQGQRESARGVYESALQGGSSTTAGDVALLLRLISRTWLHDGDRSAADDCAFAALAVSEQAGDEAGRGRAINMLGSIQWDQGAHETAEELFLEARASALVAGEAQLAAMTALNLGIIASVRGDDGEALRCFESGLGDARAAGLIDEMINALVNLGVLHTQLQRYEAADCALLEARDIAARVGDFTRLIRIELYVAKLRIKQGARADARAALDHARELSEETGETNATGDADHVAGIIARGEGDISRAERHFLAAEQFALERGDRTLEGETARELADLYRSDGRNRDALQQLNRAHRIFQQLRARRELADVDRRTAVLESVFLDVVRRWGESIDAKDMYTQGHCIRVADLAGALWSRVGGGDDASLFWFRIGALLHDVGKLMVPAEVLNKHDQLSDDEWALMRRHPIAGVELLADIDFPWDVRPIVESHHERWDGAGYPHGLAGEAIPLAARVLCIADVYDALTTKRSYKDALSHDRAMEVMRQDVGAQFDPTLFAAFEAIVRRGTFRGRASGEMRAIA